MFDGELLHEIVAAPVEQALSLKVAAVCQSPVHSFAKQPRSRIELLAGLGVDGDVHCGATDQHLFRGRASAPPNLRQLHLLAAETLDLIGEQGFTVAPGALGENILTRGCDLLSLPQGTLLHFPSGATAQLTGRRTPCRQIDRIRPGLMRLLGGERGARWGENAIAGVMAVIVQGGSVGSGDAITVGPAPWPHLRLAPL